MATIFLPYYFCKDIPFPVTFNIGTCLKKLEYYSFNRRLMRCLQVKWYYKSPSKKTSITFFSD